MPFDRSKFIEQFKTETREHLEKLNKGLLKLEKTPGDSTLLDEMMREAHTIKGSAGMLGYKRIADISHRMESGLQKALKGELLLKKWHFDMLFKCVDSIPPLLEDKLTWEDKGMARPFVDDLCAEVDAAFSSSGSKKEAGVIHKPEKVITPLKSPESPQASSEPVHEDSMRVEIDKLNKLMNLSGELTVSKIRLDEIVRGIVLKSESRETTGETFKTLVKELKRVDENIQFVSSNIQDEVMKVRMVPVAYLFNLFPRAMRDLAADSGKSVNIEIRGEEARLDKAIIDQMRDPIMHILRNSVDHGIEMPDERIKKKKSETGTITLNAYQIGSQVIMEVSDDGKGVDVDRVKAIAVQKNLIKKDDAASITDEQAFGFLFIPGFSTKTEVTETSGRGVGLDVVRERVAKLKGTIEIDSSKDSGMKITIKLPLTLAITECLLVTSGSETFAIPIDSVVETIRIELSGIKTVEAREAITVRGRILPLVRLSDIFNIQAKGIVERKFFSAIVVQSVEKRIVLLVDTLIGRIDIVSKPLGDPVKNVKYIGGATILGDGRVILIVDIPSIIDSFEGGVILRKRDDMAPKTAAPVKKRKKTILLAEDAMSTAMLEKNILESSGFSVVIARDGREAAEKASQEKFDLVITDVLMPRMDGFELTAHLKSDKLYKDIPVIIVTTRESDADKRRGLEVGADAYILKSEFTSEGLLNTIERLIG